MTEKKARLSRRNFLLTVGAGGAATAAAIVATKNPTPSAETSEDKRRGKGYQESAHVRSYYNTAKV